MGDAFFFHNALDVYKASGISRVTQVKFFSKHGNPRPWAAPQVHEGVDHTDVQTVSTQRYIVPLAYDAVVAVSTNPGESGVGG